MSDRIRDPRARALQGEQAGIVTRAIADLIDLGLAEFLFLGTLLGVGVVRYVAGLDPTIRTWSPATWIVVLLQWWMLTMVFAVGWAGGGRTLGKAILGLRVARRDGSPVRIGRALIRAAVCAAAPGILIFVALSRQNRGIHDALLGTRVTYDWSTRSA